MDDLISKASAIDALGECPYNWNDWPEEIQAVNDWEYHKEAIENIPAVDAVPVVRCRDCKYSDTFADTTTATTPLKCLNIRYGGVFPDWYCEHGERRDEDGSTD